jgi:hypothetical protein
MICKITNSPTKQKKKRHKKRKMSKRPRSGRFPTENCFQSTEDKRQTKEMSSDEVTLISQDGEEFKVSTKVANLSAMIGNIIGEDEQDDEEKRIPLPNVRREILSKVLEFCNHYTNEKMTEFVKVSYLSGYLYLC